MAKKGKTSAAIAAMDVPALSKAVAEIKDAQDAKAKEMERLAGELRELEQQLALVGRELVKKLGIGGGSAPAKAANGKAKAGKRVRSDAGTIEKQMQAIAGWLAGTGEAAAKGAIVKGTGMGETAVSDRLNRLRDSGYVKMEGDKKTAVWSLTAKGKNFAG